MANESLALEQAMQELEEVVHRLEEGQSALEESMALFERGQELVAICNKALDGAELRLQKVRTSIGGVYEVVPLEEAEER